MVNKRRGRPSEPSERRELILYAARMLFLQNGYAGTTLRAIAAEADVDHALVNYYFGSKDALFCEAVLDGLSASAILRSVSSIPELPPGQFPQLLARTFVTYCESSPFQERVLPAFRYAMKDDDTRAIVSGYFEREILAGAEELLLRLRAQHPGHPRLSTADAVVQNSIVLLGALVSRYVLQVQPHASISPDQFASVLARLIRVSLL